MSAFVDIVTPASLTVATTAVVLRYGPTALITLIAGMVAALSRHSRKGERALAVLTLLHGSSRPAVRRRSRP